MGCGKFWLEAKLTELHLHQIKNKYIKVLAVLPESLQRIAVKFINFV